MKNVEKPGKNSQKFGITWKKPSKMLKKQEKNVKIIKN